jgi:hypothetical protein
MPVSFVNAKIQAVSPKIGDSPALARMRIKKKVKR